jgi:cell wall-associated NlpC family hydrolase
VDGARRDRHRRVRQRHLDAPRREIGGQRCRCDGAHADARPDLRRLRPTRPARRRQPAYNHASWYVAEVLALAHSYGQTQAQTVAAGSAPGVALDWALAQVGTPYIWGGETPGVGFDCSGLTQAAYRAAGIQLPRTAQEQYDATAKLPPGDPLQPGDLVFFGQGATDVTHVGIYAGIQAGQPVMVDAPHTGADVRVEPFPDVVGQSWGTERYLGATAP